MLWYKIFVLKKCILILSSLHAVVRVLALNCRLPAAVTSCFPGTRTPSVRAPERRLSWEYPRLRPQLPWRGQQKYSPAQHRLWSRSKARRKPVSDWTGLSMPPVLTIFSLFSVCCVRSVVRVTVRGLGQRQFEVQSTWGWWRGLECETSGYV